MRTATESPAESAQAAPVDESRLVAVVKLVVALSLPVGLALLWAFASVIASS